MDFDILRQTLEVTLDEVAFKKDAAGNEVSILSRAQENLKAYLEEQTSITDDEKARRYAEFLTSTITSVVTQAISVAGDAPLKDAQIATENQRVVSMQIGDTNSTNETNQKIASMQNEDKARANEVAAKVAKTKYEIETLLPAQVANENKKLELMNEDVLIKQKQQLLTDKEILVKESQVQVEQERIPLLQAQVALEGAKVPLFNAQAQTELKKLDVMTEDIALKQKDQILRDKEVAIKEVLADVEQAKIPLMQYQAENERVRSQLTSQQIGLTAMEVQYKLAQIKAIQDAAQVNKEIEHEKNETQLKIAEMYALR